MAREEHDEVGTSSSSLDQLTLDQTGRTTTTTKANPLPSKTQATQPKSNTGRTLQPGVVRSVLGLGMSFLGRPYVWGGESPQEGFDCSGLVQYIFRQNGISLPRVAHDQAGVGTAVKAGGAQPGDLVFFDNNASRPGADHVGIYLGNGLMLQSPRTGKTIEVVKVDLSKAMAVRRVVGGQPNPYAGLGQTGGHYVYTAKATPGATSPKAVTPAKGGGDVASNPTGAGGGKTGVPGDPLGIGAPVATSTPGGPLPKNATPQQIRDEVARDYGYLAAFLNDKEIGPILTKAALEDWDEARLTGALTATKWWKTTSDSSRQWDAMNKIDPAKAKGQLNSMVATLADQAQALGLTVGGLQLHDMGVNALRFGWNAAQVKDALIQHGKLDPQVQKTGAGKLKEIAGQYLIPISEQTLNDWSARIARGDVTADDFETYAKEQAKSLYPSLAKAIDAGTTVRQYADPYVQLAARELEMAPDAIDLTSPRFSRFLNQIDGKTGERVSMSLSDAQMYLRQQPEWGHTKAAHAQTADVTRGILETFGAIA